MKKIDIASVIEDNPTKKQINLSDFKTFHF
ncbi:MAG: hypothetical protein RLZZ540_2125 [Bacteroidota bacterium]|jgi:hypothetical protein